MRNKNKKLTISQIISLVFCAILAVFTILGVALFAEKYPENKIIIAAIFAVCYIVVSSIIIWAFGLIDKKTVKTLSNPMLSTIMYDVVNSANEPAIICNDDGKIVWCNKYTQDRLSDVPSNLVGTKLSSLLPDGIQENTDENGATTLLTVFKKSIYSIERSKIQSGDKTYYLLMFRDITKYENLKKYVSEEEIIVAYIIVDNLEELLQFEQEKYREAAAKIELLIREWAQSVKGIVKEYEKDKYIFIFKSKNLDKFVQDKFDILDKVRAIRVGTSNISVTLSIGIAKIFNEYSDIKDEVKDKDDIIELEDKEKLAHVALDMALQRGGDQVVLRRANQEPEFFGGRTNAVQKRTKVKARVVSNQLIPMIKKAGNVIVMAHKFPDYDAFGASCGIARLAMFCGAKVNVVTNFKDTNIKKCMKFFDGNDNYKGVFVDSATGLDLIRSDTLLVIVDVNNTAMFESADIAKNVSDIVIIDHHRKTAEFEKNPLITYIETSASSASELVSEMLEQCLPPATLKKLEADMLLAGILLDTKQFTKGTGPKTYASVMYLKDNGAAYEQIQDLFKTNIEDQKQEAKFYNELDNYRHCTAIAVNRHGTNSNDRILAARVADNLLMVEDVAASFALVQIDDVIHISARSNGTINVQLILEALNGGGRFDAAGAQVKSASMNDTIMKLKKAIDNYLNPEG